MSLSQVYDSSPQALLALLEEPESGLQIQNQPLRFALAHNKHLLVNLLNDFGPSTDASSKELTSSSINLSTASPALSTEAAKVTITKKEHDCVKHASKVLNVNEPRIFVLMKQYAFDNEAELPTDESTGLLTDGGIERLLTYIRGQRVAIVKCAARIFLVAKEYSQNAITDQDELTELAYLCTTAVSDIKSALRRESTDETDESGGSYRVRIFKMLRSLKTTVVPSNHLPKSLMFGAHWYTQQSAEEEALLSLLIAIGDHSDFTLPGSAVPIMFQMLYDIEAFSGEFSSNSRSMDSNLLVSRAHVAMLASTLVIQSFNLIALLKREHNPRLQEKSIKHIVWNVEAFLDADKLVQKLMGRRDAAHASLIMFAWAIVNNFFYESQTNLTSVNRINDNPVDDDIIELINSYTPDVDFINRLVEDSASFSSSSSSFSYTEDYFINILEVVNNKERYRYLIDFAQTYCAFNSLNAIITSKICQAPFADGYGLRTVVRSLFIQMFSVLVPVYPIINMPQNDLIISCMCDLGVDDEKASVEYWKILRPLELTNSANEHQGLLDYITARFPADFVTLAKFLSSFSSGQAAGCVVEFLVGLPTCTLQLPSGMRIAGTEEGFISAIRDVNGPYWMSDIVIPTNTQGQIINDTLSNSVFIRWNTPVNGISAIKSAVSAAISSIGSPDDEYKFNDELFVTPQALLDVTLPLVRSIIPAMVEAKLNEDTARLMYPLLLSLGHLLKADRLTPELQRRASLIMHTIVPASHETVASVLQILSATQSFSPYDSVANAMDLVNVSNQSSRCRFGKLMLDNNIPSDVTTNAVEFCVNLIENASDYLIQPLPSFIQSESEVDIYQKRSQVIASIIHWLFTDFHLKLGTPSKWAAGDTFNITKLIHSVFCSLLDNRSVDLVHVSSSPSSPSPSSASSASSAWNPLAMAREYLKLRLISNITTAEVYPLLTILTSVRSRLSVAGLDLDTRQQLITSSKWTMSLLYTMLQVAVIDDASSPSASSGVARIRSVLSECYSEYAELIVYFATLQSDAQMRSIAYNVLRLTQPFESMLMGSPCAAMLERGLRTDLSGNRRVTVHSNTAGSHVHAGGSESMQDAQSSAVQLLRTIVRNQPVLGAYLLLGTDDVDAAHRWRTIPTDCNLHQLITAVKAAATPSADKKSAKPELSLEHIAPLPCYALSILANLWSSPASFDAILPKMRADSDLWDTVILFASNDNSAVEDAALAGELCMLHSMQHSALSIFASEVFIRLRLQSSHGNQSTPSSDLETWLSSSACSLLTDLAAFKRISGKLLKSTFDQRYSNELSAAVREAMSIDSITIQLDALFHPSYAATVRAGTKSDELLRSGLVSDAIGSNSVDYVYGGVHSMNALDKLFNSGLHEFAQSLVDIGPSISNSIALLDVQERVFKAWMTTLEILLFGTLPKTWKPAFVAELLELLIKSLAEQPLDPAAEDAMYTSVLNLAPTYGRRAAIASTIELIVSKYGSRLPSPRDTAVHAAKYLEGFKGDIERIDETSEIGHLLPMMRCLLALLSTKSTTTATTTITTNTTASTGYDAASALLEPITRAICSICARISLASGTPSSQNPPVPRQLFDVVFALYRSIAAQEFESTSRTGSASALTHVHVVSGALMSLLTCSHTAESLHYLVRAVELIVFLAQSDLQAASVLLKNNLAGAFTSDTVISVLQYSMNAPDQFTYENAAICSVSNKLWTLAGLLFSAMAAHASSLARNNAQDHFVAFVSTTFESLMPLIDVVVSHLEGEEISQLVVTQAHATARIVHAMSVTHVLSVSSRLTAAQFERQYKLHSPYIQPGTNGKLAPLDLSESNRADFLTGVCGVIARSMANCLSHPERLSQLTSNPTFGRLDFHAQTPARHTSPAPGRTVVPEPDTALFRRPISPVQLLDVSRTALLALAILSTGSSSLDSDRQLNGTDEDRAFGRWISTLSSGRRVPCPPIQVVHVTMDPPEQGRFNGALSASELTEHRRLTAGSIFSIIQECVELLDVILNKQPSTSVANPVLETPSFLGRRTVATSGLSLPSPFSSSTSRPNADSSNQTQDGDSSDRTLTAQTLELAVGLLAQHTASIRLHRTLDRLPPGPRDETEAQLLVVETMAMHMPQWKDISKRLVAAFNSSGDLDELLQRIQL
ncbi:hypothetical protein GQ42DRAFT_155509 [Ramicandelaber brevisporus]|nr:hypothetical protein GQ42DRAFT_155509 [Ramicandelaber brevisporus]